MNLMYLARIFGTIQLLYFCRPSPRLWPRAAIAQPPPWSVLWAWSVWGIWNGASVNIFRSSTNGYNYIPIILCVFPCCVLAAPPRKVILRLLLLLRSASTVLLLLLALLLVLLLLRITSSTKTVATTPTCTCTLLQLLLLMLLLFFLLAILVLQLLFDCHQ